MRRLSFAALLALAIAMASMAPTLAAGGHGFSVWGSLNKNSHSELDGNYQAPNGSHGFVSLVLYGSNDGFSWHPTGSFFNLKLVQGQTNYGFNFDIDKDPHHYHFYKVDGGGDSSRKFNRDECGFRVPEAPATPLLLLGAIPAGALIAVKATGIRLPRPHLHRIG